MERFVKKYDQYLNESEMASSVSYSNPLQVLISKDFSKGKQNMLKVVSNNTTRYYKIVGSAMFKDYDLNFKSIRKKSNGDLLFDRYISGGIDTAVIPFSKMSDAIKSMSKGENDVNPAIGIHFFKVKA